MDYLDRKYIGMLTHRLQRFKWTGQQTANCRCPICGDSQKNRSKARFYFYSQKNRAFVKCHNCSYSKSFDGFLGDYDSFLHSQYRMERFKDSGTSIRRNPPQTSKPGPAPVPVEIKPSRLDELVGLPNLTTLPPDNPAVEYVRNRRLPLQTWTKLFYSDNYSEWIARIDPEKSEKLRTHADARLVIPVVYRGQLVAAQGRALSNDPDIQRYITAKRDAEAGRTWYGLDDVDKSKTVYVLEGPLDSLFIPNSVSILGLSAINKIPKEVGTDPVFVLDNEPRNADLLSVLTKLVENKFRVCIWPETIKAKDINNMITDLRMTPREILEVINTNTYQGLSAKLKLAAWSKHAQTPHKVRRNAKY